MSWLTAVHRVRLGVEGEGEGLKIVPLPLCTIGHELRRQNSTEQDGFFQNIDSILI